MPTDPPFPSPRTIQHVFCPTLPLSQQSVAVLVQIEGVVAPSALAAAVLAAGYFCANIIACVRRGGHLRHGLSPHPALLPLLAAGFTTCVVVCDSATVPAQDSASQHVLADIGLSWLLVVLTLQTSLCACSTRPPPLCTQLLMAPLLTNAFLM